MLCKKFLLKLENARKEKAIMDAKDLERLGRECEQVGRLILSISPAQQKGGKNDKEIIGKLNDIVAFFTTLRDVKIDTDIEGAENVEM